MEPNAAAPELALRAYEAMNYCAGLICAAVALVATVSHMLFLWLECFSSCGSNQRKLKTSADRNLRYALARRVLLGVIIRFSRLPAARPETVFGSGRA